MNHMGSFRSTSGILFAWILPLVLCAQQYPPAKGARTIQEGQGMYEQLVIRGAILINSNGAPPLGPVDVEIKRNRITKIQVVGEPGAPIDPDRRPKLQEGGHEIDAAGMYLLSGFIDAHAHFPTLAKAPTAEYAYKLWLGHGITSVRLMGALTGIDFAMQEKKQSEENAITAPRMFVYNRFGSGPAPVNTPQEAREWVKKYAAMGVDGVKFFGSAPSIMEAALDECRKVGLRTAMHHSQTEVGRWNALHSAKAGLTSLEHWYGIPEAMFEDRTLQDYPTFYNYQNEFHRFEEAGKIWQQTAKPGSERWNTVIDQLIASGLTIVPTFNVYEANRDFMRARCAEWHQEYTTPQLWAYFSPGRGKHGSYWNGWGTEQELVWKKNYQLWMAFVNDYKNRGGRVCAGSDPGYIYQIYGFGYVRELELLREAGLSPLEVIRAATLSSAELIGNADLGSVEVGKLADLVLLEENPLANFQTLYGTGIVALDEHGQPTRKGGVVYTIKDGIVYDARKLLGDVRDMVKEEKAKQKDGLLK